MQEELLAYPIEESHSIFLFTSLVCVCLLYVLIFSFHQEQGKRLLSASVNSKAKSLLTRIDSESVNKVGRYMNVLFFVNVLLFVYGVLANYGILKSLSKTQTTALLIGVLILFLIKYLAHSFLGYLFKVEGLAKEYLQELYLKYKLFGVLMFPIILLVLFSNKYAVVAVFIGCLTYVMFWAMMLYFVISQGLTSKSFPKYYPFLYICTLEILPLALVGKLFQAPLTSLLGL